jgi:hypothetical protein
MKPTLFLLPALAVAKPLVLEQRQEFARLISVEALGDGCPAGSFDMLFNEAGKSAKASFNSFAIRAGQGVSLDNKSVGCDMTIAMSFPGPCKQAVMRTRTDGSVLVAKGAGATAAVATRFRVSSGGMGDEAPPALIFSSIEDRDIQEDIGRDHDVNITVIGETAKFTAYMEILLNAPDGRVFSETALDGLELSISQDGLC